MASPDPVAQLLRRFRAQQPLRAGSLLVTLFGDAIAPRGGAATLGSLIALAAPFGITERHVRTAVGRLAQEGWFTARRAGRRSEYHLTAVGAERFSAATQRIYGGSPVVWGQQWTMLLLPATHRAERVRNQLHWLGFGQLDAGVFIHPDAQLLQERQWLQELELPGAVLMATRAKDEGVDRQLAASGWDLQQLARGYRRFVKSFGPLSMCPARQLGAQDAFTVRTLLIHEYRKIHLRDPLLPPTLLPADWIGTAAQELCAGLYGAVFDRAEEFLSVSARTLAGSLPAPVSHIQARFAASGVSPAAPAAAAQRPAETGSPAVRP